MDRKRLFQTEAVPRSTRFLDRAIAVMVHLTEKPGEGLRGPPTPLSEQEINKRLNEMLPPPLEMPR